MTYQELFSQDNKNAWALAVDSSSHIGSLSFFNKKGLVKEISWSFEKRHSESLLVDFYKTAQALDLDINNLENIFIGIGPGSFTGIRVSCAFVKALAFANKARVLAFPSLRILAAKVNNPKKNFTVVTPSIGDLVFLTEYVKTDFLSENINYKTKDLSQILEKQDSVFIHKDFKEKIDNSIKQQVQFVHYGEQPLFESILFSFKNDLSFCDSTHLDLQPLYLRQSEAEEKYVLKEGR